MCLATNIRRRGAVYYVRISRPLELVNARVAAGLPARKEEWKSLGTKDPGEAKRLGHRVIGEFREIFDAELAALHAGQPLPDGRTRKHKPTQAEMQAAAWESVAGDLRDYEQDTTRNEARREMRAAERSVLAGVRDNWGGDTGRLERASELFGFFADALIQARGWSLPPGSPEYEQLCRLLQGARVNALKAMEARDGGDYLSTVANPAAPPLPPPPLIPASKRKAKPGESLLELLPQYMKEVGSKLSIEDRKRKENIIGLFAEHVGECRDIQTITRADIRDFKLALQHYPKGGRLHGIYRRKSFAEICKANKAALEAGTGIKPSGDKTANNNLAALGGYFKWLYSNDYAAEPNMSEGLGVKIKRKGSRDSYSADDLARMFTLPAFTGCAASDDDRAPGDLRLTDWRFWIPTICLYTGARLGEIAQLRCKDIRQVGGHWAFHITDEGEGMTAKTAGSVRVLPVHPELLRLGLLAYRDSKARAGRLFPEIEPDDNGRISRPVTEWWNPYLKRAGIVAGNSYRFRHTFTDALRSAGYLDSEISALLGHKKGSTTEGYGNLPQVTVNRRAEMVASIKYPLKLTPPVPV